MKRKLRGVITLILILAMLSSLISACGRSEDREIVINYAGSYSNALLLIMKEKEIAEKYFPDAKITWTNMAASSEMRDALVANRVTFAGLSLPSYLSALEKNLALESICYAGDTPIKMYMRTDANRQYSDLTSEDQIAMVGMNTILHIAFLVDAYHTFGDVSRFESSFVVMPHAEGLSLISSGNQISAYITTFPTTYKAEQNQNLVCIRDFTDTVKAYGIGSVVAVNKSVSQEDRENFICAMEEAQAFIEEKPNEAIQIMSEDWGIPAEAIEKVLREMPPHVSLNDYAALIEILEQIGYLDDKE